MKVRGVAAAGMVLSMWSGCAVAPAALRR